MVFFDLSKNYSGRRDNTSTARKALTVDTDVQNAAESSDMASKLIGNGQLYFTVSMENSIRTLGCT